MVRHRISRIGLTFTAAALAAVVSACGQSGNNAQPQPSASATALSSPATTAAGETTQPVGDNPPADNGFCKSADLQLSLGRAEGAAGTVYRPLVFTNASGRRCVLQGFPGVSYVAGADGHQVGAAAVRDGTMGPAVTLGKGDRAYATIGLVHAENFDPATCQPQPVRGLRVYPPQETAAMYIDLPTTGCGNDKIPGNQLTVRPVQKGTGEG